MALPSNLWIELRCFAVSHHGSITLGGVSDHQQINAGPVPTKSPPRLIQSALYGVCHSAVSALKILLPWSLYGVSACCALRTLLMIRLPAFFKFLFTVVSLPAVLLSGCQHNAQGNRYADYPIAEQFPQIYQQSIQAGAHWQLIAHNEARLLVSRFEETPTLQLADNADGNDSPFDRGFHNFLAEGLINEGARVYVAEQGMQLDYDIQLVEFSERDQLNLPPGFISASALSVYLIAHAVEQWSNPAALLIPAAIGVDVYNYLNADSATPNTEVILTVRVRDTGRLLYSHSSVYYFRTEDAGLYGDTQAIPVRGPVTL